MRSSSVLTERAIFLKLFRELAFEYRRVFWHVCILRLSLLGGGASTNVVLRQACLQLGDQDDLAPLTDPHNLILRMCL